MGTSTVFLQRIATGEPVEAILLDEISEEHVALWKTTWLPVIRRKQRELEANETPKKKWPQDLHWDWELKLNSIRSLMAYRSLCLLCEGQVQGLIILNLMERARLESQAGKELVYIEFLATAPWNRKEITAAPVFRGVGSILVYETIKVSADEEFQGRIGLHSLPQANDFYENICGMTFVGSDCKKQNLSYFEMTPEQARRFRP